MAPGTFIPKICDVDWFTFQNIPLIRKADVLNIVVSNVYPVETAHHESSVSFTCIPANTQRAYNVVATLRLGCVAHNVVATLSQRCIYVALYGTCMQRF